MPETDYLIKNCAADDFDYACPKRCSKLKPSPTAAIRHCDRWNRKVYLCKTDADIKLYICANYFIALAKTRKQAEIEQKMHSQLSSRAPAPAPFRRITASG